jgi:hypothetical protein
VLALIYVNKYLDEDPEDFGGMWEITQEGFMPGLATFVVRVNNAFF